MGFLRVIAPIIIVFAVIAFRLYIGTENNKKNVCVLNFGARVMGVTAYQPDETRDEFCNEIPFTGRTLIVLDAGEHELRDMQTEIRIIRDIGEEAEKKVNLNDITEAYLPPKKYPGGSIVFDHIFTTPGKYIGLITVTDDHQQRWIDRLPLSIGRMASRNRNLYIGLAAAVILSLAGYALYVFIRRHEKKKGA